MSLVTRGLGARAAIAVTFGLGAVVLADVFAPGAADARTFDAVVAERMAAVPPPLVCGVVPPSDACAVSVSERAAAVAAGEGAIKTRGDGLGSLLQ